MNCYPTLRQEFAMAIEILRERFTGLRFSACKVSVYLKAVTRLIKKKALVRSKRRHRLIRARVRTGERWSTHLSKIIEPAIISAGVDFNANLS